MRDSTPNGGARWCSPQIYTKSCTKDTVVRLSQQWKRRMLDWRLFRSWNGQLFCVQSEKNVVSGKFDSCTNRNYVLTGLRVIRIRKVCESMRFDSGPEVFVRVNRNYGVRTKRK